MQWTPKNWNDVLAVFLILGLPVYWVVSVPVDIVIGTTLSGWTLAVQYYFRRSPDVPGTTTTTTVSEESK